MFAKKLLLAFALTASGMFAQTPAPPATTTAAIDGGEPSYIKPETPAQRKARRQHRQQINVLAGKAGRNAKRDERSRHVFFPSKELRASDGGRTMARNSQPFITLSTMVRRYLYVIIKYLHVFIWRSDRGVSSELPDLRVSMGKDAMQQGQICSSA